MSIDSSWIVMVTMSFNFVMNFSILKNVQESLKEFYQDSSFILLESFQAMFWLSAFHNIGLIRMSIRRWEGWTITKSFRFSETKMETKFCCRLWSDYKVYSCGIDYILFLFKFNQPGIIMIGGEFALEVEVVKSDAS